MTAIWALTFPTRIVRGVSFAADRDQAAILKQAMETVIRLNPWIADVLVVKKNRVVNVAKGHPVRVRASVSKRVTWDRHTGCWSIS